MRKSKFRTILIASLTLLGAFAVTTHLPISAQSLSTVDAKKDQAWRIYKAYKQANAELEGANSTLRRLNSEIKNDAQGGMSGGGHIVTSGYGKDLAAVRAKISELQAKMRSLESSWDANFHSSYGPLSHALNTTEDPKTHKKSDSIADRVNYVPPQKVANSVETAKPIWMLKPPPAIYKSAVDNLADYSLQEGSASRGSITAQESVSLDKTKPPEIRSGCLTWSFVNKSNVSSLVPGEKLKWTATVTDTAGTGNIMGNLKFEPFGMPGNRTSGGGDMLYESPPKGGTISRNGEVLVPGGKVGDKIMIRGKVQAGRCSIVYDDVYEMSKSSGSASPSVSSGQNPKSAATDVLGSWDSQWGPVSLESAGQGSDGSLRVKGRWQQGAKGTGLIESGTYNPASGTLEFIYFQPWNSIRGTAKFSRAASGDFVGSFSQPPAYTGAWTMSRPR